MMTYTEEKGECVPSAELLESGKAVVSAFTFKYET
jgi:hypothetical protein